MVEKVTCKGSLFWDPRKVTFHFVTFGSLFYVFELFRALGSVGALPGHNSIDIQNLRYAQEIVTMYVLLMLWGGGGLTTTNLATPHLEPNL